MGLVNTGKPRANCSSSSSVCLSVCLPVEPGIRTGHHRPHPSGRQPIGMKGRKLTLHEHRQVPAGLLEGHLIICHRLWGNAGPPRLNSPGDRVDHAQCQVPRLKAFSMIPNAPLDRTRGGRSGKRASAMANMLPMTTAPSVRGRGGVERLGPGPGDGRQRIPPRPAPSQAGHPTGSLFYIIYIYCCNTREYSAEYFPSWRTNK